VKYHGTPKLTGVDYSIGFDVIGVPIAITQDTSSIPSIVLLTNVVMGTMIQLGGLTVWIDASLHACMGSAMIILPAVTALLGTLELPVRMIYRSVIQTMATVTRSVLTLSVAIAVHARMDSVL
jgi:hypothetical protein